MKAILPAILLLAACGRPSPNAPAEYRAGDGSFTAVMPGDWKVDDGPALTRKAAFFGPPGAWNEMIRVSLVAESPAAYRAGRSGLPTPLIPAVAGGPNAVEFSHDKTEPNPHGAPIKTSTRCVLIPTSKGTFVLEHTRPAGAKADSPVFEEFLRTFKPAS